MIKDYEAHLATLTVDQLVAEAESVVREGGSYERAEKVREALRRKNSGHLFSEALARVLHGPYA